MSNSYEMTKMISQHEHDVPDPRPGYLRKNFVSVSLFAAALLASVASAEAPFRIERAEGDYQLVRLSLVTEEGDSEGPPWMIVSLRDGKGTAAWLPIYAPTVDASGVRLIDGRMTGQVMDRSPAHTPGIRFVYTIDARVDGDRIVGTWKRSANKPAVMVRDPWSTFLKPASGTLTGELQSDDEVKMEQAYADGAHWATWLGPTNDRRATPTNVALIDSLFDARPVWKSETIIAAAPGRANDIPRHGVKSLYNRASGGGSSPIVADDMVLLNFYLPSGDAYDKQAAEIYTKQLSDAQNVAYFHGTLPTLGPLKVAADDVVVAVDARSGALIWRTTFPGAGANHTSHKNDLNNLTMAYADGRVYAIGSTMRLRCLDAKTGKLIWEQPLGPITAALESQRDAGITSGKWIKKRNREWGFAPIVLAGNVISHDMSGGTVAFDSKTGQEQWRRERTSWKNSTPHAWSHDGEHSVIIAGWQQISCLNAADGSVRWTIPAAAYRSITVSGNLMAYGDDVGPPDATDRGIERAKDPANRVLVVMELDLEQPRLLWHTKWKLPAADGKLVKDQYSSYCRPQFVGGRLFLGGREWTDCFDARTGKQLARLKAAGGVANAGHLLAAHDRLFSVVDGKHGTTRMAMYTTDPADFRPTGPDEVWVPPHPNTTSYGPCMLHPVVDGRIFIRGHDAIYCYDLRRRSVAR